MQHAFRQLEERGLSAEICHMKWSPCMDLIALANIQGEVLLQRLTWQRQPVWVLPAPGEETNKHVAALAWRPDGKVLAVGYAGGRIILCSVEKAEVVHTIDFPYDISCMDWVQSSVTMEKQQIPPEMGDFVPQDLFDDGSEKFLPKLPALSKISAAKGFDEKSVEDSKQLNGQTSFNILIVGSTCGHLHLLAYGISLIGEVDLAHTVQQAQCGKIISATLSTDLHTLSVIMEQPKQLDQDSQQQTYLLSLDCMLLTSRHQELSTYAMKHGKIVTYLEYLNSTLNAVSEAWEDILLEMENKLTKYAQQKDRSSGTVGDEFLRLLMWGKASPDLQAFLVNDLSEKGLKKLGHSIENSYTNIQKLVLKHIHCVGRSLLYHLSEIQGMAEWYDKYGVLGLSTSDIQEAISSVGSFMLKANELLHVIDNSMKNFRAFFRWLYVVILRLSEEVVPATISKMMLKDVNFVADFLSENFTDNSEATSSSLGATKRSGFTLERVGQYLKKDDLQFVQVVVPGSWQSFVESNPYLKDSDVVFPHHPKSSLMQLFESLDTVVRKALNKPASSIGQSVKCHGELALYSLGTDAKKQYRTLQQHTVAKSHTFYSLVMLHESPAPSIYLIKQDTHQQGNKVEAVCLHFTSLGSANQDDSTVSHSEHNILDATFYDDNTISVLLYECDGDRRDTCTSVIGQMSLDALEDGHYTEVLPGTALHQCQNIQRIDAGLHVHHYRHLDNMKASMFAVSGSRKVACVLFGNRRRVRLFDMDAEDEDDSLYEDKSTLDVSSMRLDDNEMIENKENISTT